MMTARKEALSGWGNYPVEPGFVYEPSTVDELMALLASRNQPHYIARGLGRSYGDTALNRDAGVILQHKFSRILSFDPETGILDCEAGVTLERILDEFVPKGFFPPVTPGTKYVTLGGAIANDVHGKNHHQDGSISEFLLDFDLLTGTGEVIRCSREENSDVFWATIGGIGLTGIILRARIRLVPIETAYIQVRYDLARHLDHALELFLKDDDEYKYSVAWIDCLAGGRSLGRSVLMRGNHAPASVLPKEIREPLRLNRKWKVSVPMHLPGFVLNPYSIKAFNYVYYHSFKDGAVKLVDYDRFFYPLDSVLHWNRAYGRKGFVQYQVAFPPETSREGLVKLLTRLSERKLSSFLAVLKSFGPGNQAPLSFPLEGHTLALDIPIREPELFSILKELDEIVIRYRGRLYFAKDSAMSSEMVPIMYPDLPRFLEVKKRVDPHGLFSSSMSRRLGLGDDGK